MKILELIIAIIDNHNSHNINNKMNQIVIKDNKKMIQAKISLLLIPKITILHLIKINNKEMIFILNLQDLPKIQLIQLVIIKCQYFHLLDSRTNNKQKDHLWVVNNFRQMIEINMKNTGKKAILDIKEILEITIISITEEQIKHFKNHHN